MAESWDKLDGESPAAYAAFLVYRDMGADRSLERVQADRRSGRKGARKGTKKAGASTYLRTLSARWKWKARSEAWDEHLRKRRDEVVVREHTKWVQRWHDETENLFAVSQKLLLDLDTHLSVAPLKDSEGKVLGPAPKNYKAIQVLVASVLQMKAAVRASISIDPARVTDDQLREISRVLAPTPTGVLPSDGRQ
jgi:predicted RNA-binding protein Jag